MGTNGRHLYSANSFTVGFKEPVLVPNKKFVQWNGFMDDGDWKVSIQRKRYQGCGVGSEGEVAFTASPA
jgi:hypothetical protein